MGTAWRLILDGDREAAMNMAIDEAMMLAHGDGLCPPTLRLYGWDSPSISLGYLQDVYRGGLDLDFCRAHRVHLVRRLTGGRGVLHGHDLTFSITIAETELPADNRSVLGSHSWLMGGVVEGLRLLGIGARLGAGGRPSLEQSADCFAHAAACDVVVGDRKVAGSAQVRRHGILLEQGSVPFRRPEIEPSALFGRQTDEYVDLGDRLERAVLERAIASGFRKALGVDLVEETLSEAEYDRAIRLAESRFRTEEWNLRRGSTLVDIRK